MFDRQPLSAPLPENVRRALSFVAQVSLPAGTVAIADTAKPLSHRDLGAPPRASHTMRYGSMEP
jgi:hypothetical protein